MQLDTSSRANECELKWIKMVSQQKQQYFADIFSISCAIADFNLLRESNLQERNVNWVGGASSQT